MKKINITNKLGITGTTLLLVLIFVCLLIPNYVGAATSGSIYMNYDSSGRGNDPDCVGFYNIGGTYAVWGDGINGHGSTQSQWDFCLTAAVRYASGLSDTSGLQISYAQIAKMSVGPLSQPNTNSSESDGSYVTYRISFTSNTPADATLNGSCSITPSTVNIGDNTSWSSTVSGGNGIYTYAWSGTDNLYGSSASVSKSYSTSGNKYGTVTITSGSQTIVRNCSVVVAASQTQTLTGSCSVTPNSANIGDSLNWSSSASGGTGSYTYAWSGTDGLYGNSSSAYQSYSNAGTKYGTVVITSGSQTITRNCSAVVNQNYINNLSVSCTVAPSAVYIDNDVNWYAYASGGDGSYHYSWNGTEGLYGNNSNLVWNYNYTGTKNGTVTVTSGGQTRTATCSVNVNQEQNYDNLSVSCYANPSNSQVGRQMNWYANVSGGNGSYFYSWSGTDGLNSSNQSPYMTYYTAGNKSATVTVHDNNGNSRTAYCYSNVNQNTVLAFSQVNQIPLQSAVYLSQVPYTGVADNFKLILFICSIAFFSAWIAYIIIAYKKNNGLLEQSDETK